MHCDRNAMKNRLAGYWRLEAFNVLLLPATGLLVIWAAGDTPSPALAIALVATVALLIVGTVYWRALLASIEQRKDIDGRVLRTLDLARYPIAMLIVVAVVLCLRDAAVPSTHRATALASIIFTILAIIEYINYYRVQLQHFDNMADIRRLLAGRGFRTAHLRASLRRLRARSRR